MSWQIVKELKERQAVSLAQANALRELARKETRDLTPDEVKQHDTYFATVESLTSQIAREERAGALGEAIANHTSNKLIGREQGDVMPAKDMKRYSLMRAIRKTLKGEQLDGVEGEANKEMEKRMGGPAKGSFYLPYNYRVKRELTTTSGSGSVMTTTEDELIDYLRPKLLSSKLGVKILDDLHGKIAIPQKTATATTYWLGEGGSPTGTNPTLSQVLFTPHTIGAYTDITRQYAEQTSVNAEAMVIDDLTKDIALGIDEALFQGSGSSNQPLGIISALLDEEGTPGIVSNGTNGGNPDYGIITNLETVVANNNADLGQLSYVTTPNGRGYMKVTPRSSEAVAAGFIWGGFANDNTVNSYPAFASNILPNNLQKGGSASNLSAMVFGNFNDAVIGMWGALDILVDPYTGSSSGTIRVVALQDLDVEVRHLGSFAAMVDFDTDVS
jgi:HK97 family phage major capsid protein